jgi:anti-sigma regulatory factor (Ser/Thr protein kinase)
VLAASEALTNVVMHAYRDRSRPGPMRIRAHTVDRRLLLEVEDDGVGLRPRPDSPGGFGLALIATLAAELEFARGPTGAGTLVRMAFAIC